MNLVQVEWGLMHEREKARLELELLVVVGGTVTSQQAQPVVVPSLKLLFQAQQKY